MAGAPPPYKAPITDVSVDPATGQPRSNGLVSSGWLNWFSGLVAQLDTTGQRLRAIALPDQSAAIANTPIPVGSLAGGLYRLTWFARITTPGTVSSSFELFVDFTDGGIACEVRGGALATNTIDSVKSGVLVVRSDPGSPISYSTAYSTSGATPMEYSLSLSLEAAG